MEEAAAAAAVYVVEQTSGLVRRTHASSYLILFMRQLTSCSNRVNIIKSATKLSNNGTTTTITIPKVFLLYIKINHMR